MIFKIHRLIYVLYDYFQLVFQMMDLINKLSTLRRLEIIHFINNVCQSGLRQKDNVQLVEQNYLQLIIMNNKIINIILY